MTTTTNTQKFKVGDKVEWTHKGDFESYSGHTNNFYYDIGTVVEVNPDDYSGCQFSVRWDSDGQVSEPTDDWLRLVKREEQELYISLTKDEVDEFLSTLGTYGSTFYCSEYTLAKDFINSMLDFKESKKELSEEQKKIQEALALLENSGYSCIKK